MGKKFNLDSKSLIDVEEETESVDYSQLVKPNKASKDEGRREICERATLYFNSEIYREFRYIVGRKRNKPNRVLEDLMKTYIRNNK